ncbi:mitochondrial inner membrane protein COX18 [Anoplophora glabripennis]|uniref:mitochondrial inner membrane protein COX18 n=1 Tax=Anoplophora glabripennis TaxID=217634 RepID=UPI0008757606|nr:mitochondrial inner membrane protein COX18 [Anoplophora glabripennis]
MLKINGIRLLKRNVRLCSSHFAIYNKNNDYYSFWSCNRTINNDLLQLRHFSLQSTVESIVKTQTGIFKTLSESTPVEYAQKFLLTVHDTTGLPWWASVVCSTILLRTCVTLPLAIYQHYILAKVENLKLEMPKIVKELKHEIALAIRMYNWDEKTARITFNRSVRKQWNDLIVRENCHPFKASLLLWFQIPMWISLSVAIRNLVYMLPNRDLDAKLIFTELSVGGFAFIPNLIETDSSLILPVVLGITNLAIIELQVLSRTNAPSKLQRYITNSFRGFSIIMVPIAASVPSCLTLYWTTSSVYGLVQNLVLLSPKVKRFCKIPKTVIELQHPYQQVVIGIKNKFNFVQR